MQYAIVVEIPEELLGGDDSIENACRVLRWLEQKALMRPEASRSAFLTGPITFRPLSEVIAS